MIETFANQGTEDIFNGVSSKAARQTLPTVLWAKAAKKLDQLNAAMAVADMLIPAGNKLEKLKGDRLSQFSVRINQQFRICFNFENARATNVEICDYH